MMISVEEAIQQNKPPRILAQAFLSEYFKDKPVTYPINPFQMLTDLGVPFVFRIFSNKKYEGMYLPAQDANDVAIVGINFKRPITRQRYTAAHELCHHIKDSRSSYICSAASDSRIEQYAERFAAELLMPYNEIKRQINLYAPEGCLALDQVLSISEYFGVSFLSCLLRIDSVSQKISGNPDYATLKSMAEHYHADKKRKALGHNYSHLYAQVIDAGENWFQFQPSDFIKAKFCNSYVFNDTRLEDIDVKKENVAEIVTDIRLHGSESSYCNEAHENEVAVAGHAILLEYLFSIPQNSKIDIFTTLVQLHRQLFSCAPAPEFGGKLRESMPLVIGAKFETVASDQIIPELLKLVPSVQRLLEQVHDMQLSQYIAEVVKIHHRLTVIHPFGDGNGRTLRAFMNLLLMRRGILPIYIKVEDKEEYLDALSQSDQTSGNYDQLCETIYKAVLRSQAELSEAPPL